MDRQWNPEAVTRIHLRRKVSVAVQVIDDFSGRPITSPDLQVTATELLQKPVRKGDGYFLFLDCTLAELEISAHAWTYHPGTVRVELSTLQPLRPVVKLRLTPNRSYSIPYQTTCLEGLALPDTQIRLFCENDPHPLRLLYDYAKKGPQNGRLLQIYDPTDADLEGRQFALLRKDDPACECFAVGKTVEDQEGGCLLERALSRDCKKAGASLLPLSTARADEKGRFFLPLKTLAVKTYVCHVLWAPPGGDWQERVLELEPGRVTQIDLCEHVR